MSVLAEIQAAWSWAGLRSQEVVWENDFGNLIIKDVAGRYWRLCPEELKCSVIAENRKDLDRLALDPWFLHDWNARHLVKMAREACGPLSEGRKYTLKIPAVLGGTYAPENLATIGLRELIVAAGDIARQIKEYPDGTTVHLRIVE